MARKKQQKPVQSTAQKTQQEAQPIKNSVFSYTIKSVWSQQKTALSTLFLLGFLLYANTLSHDYVLDDKIVLTHNQITKKGFSSLFDHFLYDSMNGFWANNYGVDVKDLEDKNLVSGGRYRPVTMVTHSIEYGLFGKSPFIGHLINALLYGATGFLLFVFLSFLFPVKDQKWYWNIPFIATLLFVVHPLHTEVVANIKGRDEILSFFFALLALNSFVKFVKGQNDSKSLVYTCLFFGLALFSKETALPFLVILPLTAITFFRSKLKELAMPILALVGVTALYMVVRFSVLGWESADVPNEIMNNPFLRANSEEKWATIVLSFLAYLKLMVFPHPLTHDYYPFHLPFLDAEVMYANWSTPLVFVSIVTGVALLVVTIREVFLRQSVLGFGLAWFFGTLLLVSNVLFPVGVFMNERFLYIPSAGLLLVGTVYLFKWVPTVKDANARWVMPLLFVLVGAMSVKTISRNTAWESDRTLALTDVEISEGSAKVKMSAGLQIMQQHENSAVAIKRENFEIAIGHLSKAIEIHPTYVQALTLIGKAHFQLEEYAKANVYFLRLAGVNPNFENRSALLFVVAASRKMMENGEIQSAVESLQALQKYYPNASEPLTTLGEAYGRYLNKPQESEAFLLKALQIAPTNADALMNLGTLYAQQRDLVKAKSYFEQAMRYVPNNMVLLQNLAAIYSQLGDVENYQRYAKRIQDLQQNTKK